MKIVTTKTHRANQKIQLPFVKDGVNVTVEFNGDCEADLDESFAKQLDNDEYAYLAMSVKGKAKVESKEEVVEPEKEPEKTDEVENEEIVKLRAVLEDKTMSELREMSEKAELPESEWSGFKGKAGKDEFVNYLIEKLS